LPEELDVPDELDVLDSLEPPEPLDELVVCPVSLHALTKAEAKIPKPAI